MGLATSKLCCCLLLTYLPGRDVERTSPSINSMRWQGICY